ncbi:MAG TPA: ATP-binding protein [Flavisolibacter sp.]|nr:ATP-binding protein [Flavisolibacter sp.]
MSLPKLAALVFAFLFTTLLSAQDTTLQRLQAMKDDTLKIKALTDYAVTFYESDPEKSLSIFKQVVKIGQNINHPYSIGQAWIDIGSMQAQLARDQVAVESFKKAIPYFKQINRVDKVAACLLNIGACAERFGDINGRIQATMDAVNLLEKTNHKALLAHGYNSLGITFYNQDDFTRAKPYFEKGLTVARHTKDTFKQVQALYGLSNCAVGIKNFPVALTHSLDALALAKASGKNKILLLAYTSLSELAIKMRKGEEAVFYATEIINYADKIKDTHYRLLGLMNLAEGYALKGDQQKRIAYLNKAMPIATENGVVIQLDDIYKSLSEAHEKMGDHKASLAAFKQHIFYKDSTINLQSNKAIAEMEIKYQTAQKEKALSDKQLQIIQKDLQLQKSRQYTFYSITAAVFALLIALGLSFFYRNRKKTHQRNLKAMQQEKELQVLQAVLQGEEKERSRIAKDLHDGVAGMLAAVKMHFSSVSVQHQNIQGDAAFLQGIRLLDEASQEVRKTSHNLMPEVLLQHGLDVAIRRYCQNISGSNVLQVQYDSWGEMRRFKSNFELSVYRIVQELLNNIVKHSRASNALVQVSQQGTVLSITVEDNGIGFNPQTNQSDGMGLHSLQSRVEAINGQIQVDATTGSGVSAYLEFDTAGMESSLVIHHEKETIVTI